MNILVTGATGFIGSHLVDHLVHDHTVTCFVRGKSNVEHLQTLPVKFKYYLDYLDHYDIIYHLAGVLGANNIPYADYFEAHVAIPNHILNQMKPLQLFIYMSSGWVKYPEKPYEKTKIEGEAIVKSSKIPYMIVRPGFVYGPRDMHLLPLFRWIKRLGRFFPIPGSGRNLVCPTFVLDVVKFMCPLNLEEGEYFVAGIPITMNSFISDVAEALGVPKPFIHIPPVIKADFFTKERIFDNPDNTTLLEVGLRETVKWQRQNNFL